MLTMLSQKRMAAERLRALVEGAAFMVHTAAGACLLHLWLQCVFIACLSALQYGVARCMVVKQNMAWSCTLKYVGTLRPAAAAMLSPLFSSVSAAQEADRDLAVRPGKASRAPALKGGRRKS